MIEFVENKLKEDLKTALREVITAEDHDVDIPGVDVEVPREKSHGDYATNIALVMAGILKCSPRQIAESIMKHFSCELVKDYNIAGPGFINFTLNKKWLYKTLDLIMSRGKEYGKINAGGGQRVQVEFVSANPTGPLHVGHSRGAVVGDVLAGVLSTAGYDVEKEYYINDAGSQMDIMGESTLVRYKQALGQDAELPENAYAGDYLKDVGQDLKREYGDSLLAKLESEQMEICCEFAYDKMLTLIKEDLNGLGVKFDTWFSERDLHQGEIKEAVDLLTEKGYIYEEDGAVWFKSAHFGDDKDRVVIKSDGSPTYLAADIAYHLDKLKRGFDLLINIWGADHHGYIPRVKAAVEAFGYSPDMLEVVVVQMVTLLREGKKVPMSKRAGSFVTLRDVVEEVGQDAARYFYIMRSTDSHFDFDLDLAKEQSNNNPVYYIQYAHARIQSILENADDELMGEKILKEKSDLTLLKSEEEIDLMKLLARYPEEIKLSAEKRQPHYMTTYAYELANAFHVFYNKRRVITDDRKMSAARIYLVLATRQVLKNILNLLGISAPDQM